MRRTMCIMRRMLYFYVNIAKKDITLWICVLFIILLTILYFYVVFVVYCATYDIVRRMTPQPEESGAIKKLYKLRYSLPPAPI